MDVEVAKTLFYCQEFGEDSSPDFHIGPADELSIVQTGLDEGS